jgi:hypothetical protein
MNPALCNLVQQSLNHYQAALNHPSLSTFVPDCAMPVAWFGDSDAYFRSPKRIVTVGLNPKSGINPKWHQGLIGAAGPNLVQLLYAVYDDYFIGNTLFPSINPSQWNRDYLEWFKSLDTYLRKMTAYMNNASGANAGLDVSYNGALLHLNGKHQTKNTMLHLDLYSTSPTNHAWSLLPNQEKQNLIQSISPSGIDLFRSALAALNPDVVILGIGARNGQLGHFFAPVANWGRLVHDSSNALTAARMAVDLNTYTGQSGLNTNAQFVWLRSSQKPFANCLVSDAVQAF